MHVPAVGTEKRSSGPRVPTHAPGGIRHNGPRWTHTARLNAERITHPVLTGAFACFIMQEETTCRYVIKTTNDNSS